MESRCRRRRRRLLFIRDGRGPVKPEPALNVKIIRSLREMMHPEPPESGTESQSPKANPKSGPEETGQPKPPPNSKTPPENKTEASTKEGKDAKSAEKPGPMLIQEGTKAAEWKNHPAREEWCPPILAARYPELKAHVYEDSYSMERVLDETWRVAGATRRGKQHAHQGTHREDAFRFRAGPNFTVLCVADGAGSAKFSRLGSHVAVLRVTEYLGQNLAQMDAKLEETPEKLTTWLKTQISSAVRAACLSLREMAGQAQAGPKDFRCTLLTAVRFQAKKQDFLLTNQIGDGAICALFKDKTIRRSGVSDSGEFSGEVSCFVPDECADKKALDVQVIAGAENLECLLLCTDGIEDPFYPMEKKAIDLFRQLHTGVKEKLTDFTSQPTQGAALANESAGWGLGQWLGFEKRGENDDRSILLLHRYPSSFSF
jgi:serine/threonine protein phosphatase PrpC